MKSRETAAAESRMDGRATHVMITNADGDDNVGSSGVSDKCDNIMGRNDNSDNV